MANPGSVTFTSSTTGRTSVIPVGDLGAVVYRTGQGRDVTSAEVEQWAADADRPKARATLRKRSLRAAGREAERGTINARQPAMRSDERLIKQQSLLKGMVRGHGQAPPVPPRHAPRPETGEADRLRAQLADVEDDLDRERAVSGTLRRQLDEARRHLADLTKPIG